MQSKHLVSNKAKISDEEKYLKFLLAPDKMEPIRPATTYRVKSSVCSNAGTISIDSSKETIAHFNFQAGTGSGRFNWRNRAAADLPFDPS